MFTTNRYWPRQARFVVCGVTIKILTPLVLYGLGALGMVLTSLVLYRFGAVSVERSYVY